LAVVFVLIILLVAQHPNLFSQPINSVWGKFLITIIVVLLTNYNIVAGLIAAILVIGLYVYLHDSGYEGFENTNAKPDPSAPVASTGKTEPAIVTENGEEKDTTVTTKFGPPPVDKPKEKPVATPSSAPTANMVDKQLSAAEQVKSLPAKSLPAPKGKSETVEAFSQYTGSLPSASFIKN
jgi:hypothetical protein